MADSLANKEAILLYNNGGDKEYVSVILAEENFWLSQNGMAELFGCTSENIIQHLKNIYTEEELTSDATTKKFLVFRKKQDADYISEFDRAMARYLKGGEPE